MIFLIVLIVSLILQLILPWYIVGIIAFIVALLIGKTSWGTFLQCFLAIAILWIDYAIYLSIQGDNILINKMSALFKLPEIILYIITGLIGGLVAGLGGLSGFYLQRIIKKDKIV